MLNMKSQKDKKDKDMRNILKVQLNDLQKFLLTSSTSGKGIFNNNELERVLRGKELRQRKLSKYQIELAKWKKEMDDFDEINVELNLNLDEYLAIKKFQKPL